VLLREQRRERIPLPRREGTAQLLLLAVFGGTRLVLADFKADAVIRPQRERVRPALPRHERTAPAHRELVTRQTFGRRVCAP